MPDNSEEFTIPGDSIIHPLLNKPLLRFKKQSYQRLLDSFDLRFPEGTEQDADHIWLTPVVSQQNIAAIEKLIENGIVSQKTAVDILMIDFKKPALSQPRCALLKFVPQKFSADWQAKFMAALARSTEPQARELKKYLLEPDAFAKFHKPAIDNYITSLSDEKALPALFKNLLILRLEVFVNEISKNPLGQILEPGFRVIFPIAGTKISMN